MEIMPGKKYLVSGMTIKILSDAGDRWETRNLTTQETLFFNKAVLDNAIRLGKAEELTDEGSR